MASVSRPLRQRATARPIGGSLFRFGEIDGMVSRKINYGYCGDTLACVAAKLGILLLRTGYHQGSETLDRMIANAQLPWDATRALGA
jgi:hypothetical protein